MGSVEIGRVGAIAYTVGDIRRWLGDGGERVSGEKWTINGEKLTIRGVE